MTDHAHTLLILTDAESRLIRAALEAHLRAEMDKPADTSVAPSDAADALMQPLEAFYRGITRGTEKLAAEFAERQRAKRPR